LSFSSSIPKVFQYNQVDTVRLDTVYQKAYSLYYSAIFDSDQSALQLFEQAAVMYKETQKWTLFTDCLIKQAIIQIKLQKYKDAGLILDDVDDYLTNYIQEGDSLYSDFYYAKGSLLHSENLFREAIASYNKAIHIRDSLGIRDNTLSFIYNNLGRTYNSLSDYTNALDWFRHSFGLKEQKFGPDDPRLGSSYNNLGTMYMKLGRMDEAIRNILKGAQLFEKSYGTDNIYLGVAYNNLGFIYDQQNDFQKALDYYQSAIRIFEKQDARFLGWIANALNNIGLVYRKINNYEESLDWLMRSLETKIRMNSVELSSTYINIAETHQQMRNYSEATAYFLKAIEHTINLKGDQSVDLAKYYLDYGLFVTNVFQDFETGMDLYQKALFLCLHNFGIKHPVTSTAYRNIGNLFQEQEELDSAIVYIQKSIVSLVDDFDEEDYRKNPKTDEAISAVQLLNSIKEKAILTEKLYYKDGELADLELCFSTLEIANMLVEEIRSGFQTEESKMILAQNEHRTYHNIIRIALQLFQLSADPGYKEKAFEYSEKSKSANLLASIRNIEAKELGGIPDDLIEQESILKNELNSYKELVYKERGKENPKEDEVQLWEDYIFLLQKQIDTLIDFLEEEYSEYHSLKFITNVADHEGIASILKKDEVLLEYTVSDSILTAFLHTRKDFIVHQTPIDSLFLFNARFIREILTNRNFSKGVKMDFTQFTHASHALYDKLIRPFETLIDGSRLIIIPDETLAYIPFEILISNLVDSRDPDYQNLPYLITKHPISYSNSATLLVNKHGKKRSSSKRFLAFAPKYEREPDQHPDILPRDEYRNNLYPIPGVEEEVSFIHDLFGGDVFLNGQATEANFKKFSSIFDIVHLAMHTIIDDVNPMYSKLVFTNTIQKDQDGLLNTYEVYGLSLNARMVVLSSCNSGTGKMQKGEGVMSLARGFIYAGCPSIIMTLWEVEDYASSEIMRAFYTYLKKGYSKDVALQKAKLDFLKIANMQTSHPYFWSGYVNIGDPSPLNNRRISLLTVSFMLAFLGLLTGLYILFRKLR